MIWNAGDSRITIVLLVFFDLLVFAYLSYLLLCNCYFASMYVVGIYWRWKGRYAPICCISLFPAVLMKARAACFMKSLSVFVFLEVTSLHCTSNSCLSVHKHLICLSVFLA